jgi:excisionase family DNA binding protein
VARGKKSAAAPEAPRDLMTTSEIAAYLHLRERKVYALIRAGAIPCTRVSGKWLFPRALIDRWLAENTALPGGVPPAPAAPPAVLAGSHDPLLEWAARESACGLAMLTGGSLDGLKRLAAGAAVAAGCHVLEAATGQYNLKAVREVLAQHDVVLITWAWRQQGLVLAPGNPLRIHSLADLRERRARVAQRQGEAGSQVLLLHLLAQVGVAPESLHLLPHPARTHLDLATAVLEGKADAGLAVEAAARQLRLDFLALHRERYDLAVRRREYFEPPFQKLLAFARTPHFAERAQELGGYDIKELGRVVYNGP